MQTVKNGIVLPAILNGYDPWSYSGGMCDGNFNFVSGLLRGDYSYIHGDILTSYKCDENSVIYSCHLWRCTYRTFWAYVVGMYGKIVVCFTKSFPEKKKSYLLC